MIIRNVCGVLETFIELALSVGMFVEICGKEKLRGRLARIAAVVVLGGYAVLLCFMHTVLLLALADTLFIIVCLVLVLEYHTVIRTNHILLANESRMMVYYNLLNDEINQKRKKNHDRRYEQEYLFDCLMQKQYEKGLRYLKEKCGGKHSSSNEIYTGSGMIDNLIGRIAEQCRESQVKSSFMVDMHKFPIEESEFFVLLANLLDNAVEAARKCSDERYIALKIQERHSVIEWQCNNQLFYSCQYKTADRSVL